MSDNTSPNSSLLSAVNLALDDFGLETRDPQSTVANAIWFYVWTDQGVVVGKYGLKNAPLEVVGFVDVVVLLRVDDSKPGPSAEVIVSRDASAIASLIAGGFGS